MDENDLNIVIILVVLLLGLFLGALIGHGTAQKDHREACIKNGIGYYNSTNGNFELKNLNN